MVQYELPRRPIRGHRSVRGNSQDRRSLFEEDTYKLTGGLAGLKEVFGLPHSHRMKNIDGRILDHQNFNNLRSSVCSGSTNRAELLCRRLENASCRRSVSSWAEGSLWRNLGSEESTRFWRKYWRMMTSDAVPRTVDELERFTCRLFLTA